MNEIIERIYDFIVAKIPRNIEYMDLAQLCIGFHVYT